MSPKEQTVETYNTSAEALAQRYNMQGARIDDIEYVFSMQDKQNPSVFEIGCGNGRDAEEICKRTDNYTGIDISEKFIEMAKTRLPGHNFILADVEKYNFPENIDIVFAFASLIHVPKESFKKITSKLFSSANTNGLVFISLKYAEIYTEITKDDEFGTRTYWHYSQSDVAELASDFSIVHVTIQEAVGQIWLDVLFQKK
jgi:SAM-dependent methyltransferase